MASCEATTESNRGLIQFWDSLQSGGLVPPSENELIEFQKINAEFNMDVCFDVMKSTKKAIASGNVKKCLDSLSKASEDAIELCGAFVYCGAFGDVEKPETFTRVCEIISTLSKLLRASKTTDTQRKAAVVEAMRKCLKAPQTVKGTAGKDIAIKMVTLSSEQSVIGTSRTLYQLQTDLKYTSSFSPHERLPCRPGYHQILWATTTLFLLTPPS